jgi:hypothetical protein
LNYAKSIFELCKVRFEPCKVRFEPSTVRFQLFKVRFRTFVRSWRCIGGATQHQQRDLLPHRRTVLMLVSVIVILARFDPGQRGELRGAALQRERSGGPDVEDKGT